MRSLAAHGVNVTWVVTEMRFDTRSPVPKLTFKPVRGLTEKEIEICQRQSTTPEALTAVKHTFTIKTETARAEEAAPKAKSEDEPAKPKSSGFKPVKKAEPVAEGEVPEPTKVKSAKSEAPIDDAKMAALIDDWAE